VASGRARDPLADRTAPDRSNTASGSPHHRFVLRNVVSPKRAGILLPPQRAMSRTAWPAFNRVVRLHHLLQFVRTHERLEKARLLQSPRQSLHWQSRRRDVSATHLPEQLFASTGHEAGPAGRSAGPCGAEIAGGLRPGNDDRTRMSRAALRMPATTVTLARRTSHAARRT